MAPAPEQCRWNANRLRTQKKPRDFSKVQDDPAHGRVRRFAGAHGVPGVGSRNSLFHAMVLPR
jgi:hypothetical protein